VSDATLPLSSSMICPLQSPFVRSATLKDLRPEQQRVAACDPPLLPLEADNTAPRQTYQAMRCPALLSQEQAWRGAG
jgi:hypothetical protein